jgi:hypothetical protein
MVNGPDRHDHDRRDECRQHDLRQEAADVAVEGVQARTEQRHDTRAAGPGAQSARIHQVVHDLVPQLGLDRRRRAGRDRGVAPGDEGSQAEPGEDRERQRRQGQVVEASRHDLGDQAGDRDDRHDGGDAEDDAQCEQPPDATGPADETGIQRSHRRQPGMCCTPMRRRNTQ